MGFGQWLREVRAARAALSPKPEDSEPPKNCPSCGSQEPVQPTINGNVGRRNCHNTWHDT